MSRHAASVLVPIVLALFPARAGATPQQSGVQPHLAIVARSLAVNGASTVPASSPHPMTIGESVTTYLFAGRGDADPLCTFGGSEERARNFGELLREYAHVWKVTRTGRSYEGGRLTFDIEWARHDDGATVPAAAARQRLTLAEGERYPLDLLRSGSPGNCKVAAVAIEVEAGTTENPALADTILQYDLWLVRQDAEGKKHIRHVVTSGKQGAAIPFDFSPFRFDVPRLIGDQYEFDLVTRIGGILRGRVNGGGRVALDLETTRSFRLERPEERATQPIRSGGRKQLDVALGEAIEVELPVGSGSTARPATPSSPALSGRISALPRRGGASPSQAVVLQGEQLVVNFGPFFEKDRFSLIVQVKKADGAEQPPTP